MRNKNGRKGRKAGMQRSRKSGKQRSTEKQRSWKSRKVEKQRGSTHSVEKQRSEEAKRSREAEKRRSKEAKNYKSREAGKSRKAKSRKAKKQGNRNKKQNGKNNTSINKAPRLTKTSKEALYCLESANLFNLNPLAFCPIFRCEVLTTIQNIARSGFVHGQGLSEGTGSSSYIIIIVGSPWFSRLCQRLMPWEFKTPMAQWNPTFDWKSCKVQGQHPVAKTSKHFLSQWISDITSFFPLFPLAKISEPLSCVFCVLTSTFNHDWLGFLKHLQILYCSPSDLAFHGDVVVRSLWIAQLNPRPLTFLRLQCYPFIPHHGNLRTYCICFFCGTYIICFSKDLRMGACFKDTTISIVVSFKFKPADSSFSNLTVMARNTSYQSVK